MSLFKTKPASGSLLNSWDMNQQFAQYQLLSITYENLMVYKYLYYENLSRHFLRQLVLYISVFILIFYSSNGFAQSAQEPYGKNRIQYQNFNWSVVSTDNFDIYYYPQSKPVALLAAQYAENEYERLADLLGYAPYSRIKLIVYATHSDLIQSNIGLSTQTVFIGGYTVFLKNKVEVAFNGIQTDYKKEITKGIATMILNEMMFGGNLKDVLLNTYFMSLPEWYLSGLVEYLGEGWSTEADDKIRDLFASRNFRKPSKFSKDDATTAGHSVWNYIVERYGKSNISNILNNTRLSKNYEESISEVSMTKYNQFLRDWRAYYQTMTKEAKDSLRIPDDSLRIIKYTKNEAYYGGLKLSPDGSRIAYVQNRKGRYKVLIKNLETGKQYVVYRGGYKSYDQKVNYDMPVISWRNNDKIGVINVKRDKLKLITYDIKKEIKNTKERVKLEIGNFFNIRYTKKQTYRGIYKHMRQVNEFCFSEDGATVVISGENKLGQSDIFIYNLRNNNVVPVTNDIYDDRNPVFVPKSTKAFVFNSNRLTDTLAPKSKTDHRKVINQHDIFYYNADSSKILAKRITNSKANEIAPKISKDGSIYFLSDANGVNELYKTQLTNFKSPKALTNFRQSIQSYDLSNADSALAYVLNVNGRRRLYMDTTFDFQKTYDSLPKTSRQILFENTIYDYKTYKDLAPPVADKVPVVTRYELVNARKQASTLKDTSDIDTEMYVFEFEKKALLAANGDTSKANATKTPVTKKRKLVEIQMKYNELYISSPLRYKNDFGIDNVTTSLRIDPLRGTGIQANAHMSDIMSNHRFNVGAFVAFNFATSILWGEYEYLKNRVDFKARITKDVLLWNQNPANQRYTLYKFEATASYPLNPMTRISITPFFTTTKYANILPNYISYPDAVRNYIGGTLEFVFDNSRQMGVNMTEGTKIKFGFTQNMSLTNANQNFGKIYVDARRYLKVHRELILALRASAGSFVGPAQKNFLIGGMDNWLIGSSTNNDATSPLNTAENQDNTDLLFMEYITNLRGFQYSQFHGSNFALINAELRLPIFKYLIRRNIKSNFIRNFQVATFYDVGSAWTGTNPFSSENSINTTPIIAPPFYAQVTNYSNPFLQGYGFGVRSMIAGYYAKFDAAWGIQDFVAQPVKLYVTLGYDF